MRPVIQRLAVAILAMVVGVALVQGRTLGYLCDCGDMARLVPVPDCHQVECHPEHAHSDGCDEVPGHPSGGADHSHDHPALEDQPDGHGPESATVDVPGMVAAPMRISFRCVPPVPATPAPVPDGSCIPPPPRRTFLTSMLRI